MRTGSGGRDRQQMAQLEPFLARYQAAHDTGARNDALERFRWLLEEFRVSLFAQHLGTSEPVSAVRLERAWDEVAAALPTPPGS